MTYSAVEKEVIILKAVQEIIDEMVNHEVVSFSNGGPHVEVRFRSMTYQQFFNIILVDFLSETDDRIIGEKIYYLKALERICKYPVFNIHNSVNNLKVATTEFQEWLNQEVNVKFDNYYTRSITNIKICRNEFLKICGNISKHNFSRLGSVTKQLIKIFERNSITINQDESLMILTDFYEKFHDDIFCYHSSTLTYFLNQIRWGIHSYLLPEFKNSYEKITSEKLMYKYTYPTGITNIFAKTVYWDLMNIIRSSPPVDSFFVSKYLGLRY